MIEEAAEQNFLSPSEFIREACNEYLEALKERGHYRPQPPREEVMLDSAE